MSKDLRKLVNRFRGKSEEEIREELHVEPLPEEPKKKKKTNGYKRPQMPMAAREHLRKNLKMEKCKYCHAVEDLTMDHKIPVVKGGSDDLKNMQCLCRRCNQMKSGMTEGEVKAFFKWHLLIMMEREARKNKVWIK